MSRWQHPAFSQPQWEHAAACQDYPTDWWFTESPDAAEAFATCARCDVRDACLTFAIAHPDLLGIWGATTSEARADMRRIRRETRAPRPAPPAEAPGA